MIPVYALIGIVAAICLLQPLYRGALQDLKEFRFSEKHFDCFWVNAAIVLAVTFYIAAFINNGFEYVIWLLATSVIATLVFSFIAFRYGNGGDWRAMIYIAWIAPWLLLPALIIIGICGVIQSIYWLTRDDIDTPKMFRKIPFAVSIFAGYAIAILYVIIGA